MSHSASPRRWWTRSALDRLIELGVGGGDFADAGADAQQEMASAVLSAAEACDVPISSLGG